MEIHFKIYKLQKLTLTLHYSVFKVSLLPVGIKNDCPKTVFLLAISHKNQTDCDQLYENRWVVSR